MKAEKYLRSSVSFRSLGSALIVTLVLCAVVVHPASAHAQSNAPIDITVPVSPVAVRADGQMNLVYELHVTNLSDRDLSIWRLEVQTDDRDALVLAQYEGSELTERLARPAAPQSLTDKRRIGPGLRAVVFLWLTVDIRSSLPAGLLHRVTFSKSESTNSVVETVVEGVRLKVSNGPLVLGPPLAGSEWLAANGPSNISLHRRALIPVDGKARIAQRFAIDWLKLGVDGSSFSGDRSRNSSYHAYGAQVFAVADGVVASTKDGIPENVPGPTSRAVPITMETIAGNYVILDLGNGRFALYAHLQPGSIKVKTGDKVRRRQVLGLVGNSGNSSEPHLHFHVSDANSPLGTEGLPYVLWSFQLQGRGIGWKAADSKHEERRMEIPLQNYVVRFHEPSPEIDDPSTALEANPSDVASIDSIIAALYDVISGPAGKKRDWERFRSLFVPGARLIPTRLLPTGSYESQAVDVAGYIAATSRRLERDGFFEREIARRTETFGHIAQVFSTYESRRKAEDPVPFARGINSIQLMNDGKRWWIVSVFWQGEDRTNPIPKKYLKGKK